MLTELTTPTIFRSRTHFLLKKKKGENNGTDPFTYIAYLTAHCKPVIEIRLGKQLLCKNRGGGWKGASNLLTLRK